MDLVKAALQGCGTGLHDSSLNCQVPDRHSRSVGPTIHLSPLVHTVIEEPVTLFVSADERGIPSERPLLRTSPMVLQGGEVRPYTADEVRATMGTEFAFGKAVHTFIGHYAQSASTKLHQDATVKEGQGAMYFADGGFFLGQWRNNMRCGLGALYSACGYAYEGEFRDNVPQGRGLEYFPGEQVYMGEFMDGRPHGRGVMYYHRNGSVYVGEYSRGEKHGRGVVFYENGDVFEGHWAGGRRSGEGVSTCIKEVHTSVHGNSRIVRQSLRAQWHRDKCKWETVRFDSAYKAPSLERYIEEGVVTPFESLDSPFGCSVGSLSVAHELVREIPSLLLRRLERCFDRLDEMFTGEVPISTLEAAFEGYPTGEGVLRSITGAAHSFFSSSLRYASSEVHVDFFVFLQGLFPHLSETEIQRHITQELSLETLLRLRGMLAGVVSGKKDGFLHIAQVGPECEGLRGASQGSRIAARKVGVGHEHNKKKGEGETVGTVKLAMEQLDAARGVLGGLCVPRGLFLRQKVLHGCEELSFLELLEGLYPCVPLHAIRRVEVTSLTPHVFHGYLQAFSRLDEKNTGYLYIQAMIAAKRRYTTSRAKGYTHIPQPENALERFLVPGRRRCRVHWEISDIALSISFAMYIDRLKSGSVTLADVLRHAYPNVPCAATKKRLLSSVLLVRRGLQLAGSKGETYEVAVAEDQNSPSLPHSPTSCSCCICTMCSLSGLPTGAFGVS